MNAADDLTAWSLADDGSISAVGGAYDAGQQTYAFDVVNGVTAIARFPFTDVVAGTWYYGAAAYAYNNGLFAGMTPTTFAPNATMTRAMLVSVLWRLAGAPAPEGTQHVRGCAGRRMVYRRGHLGCGKRSGLRHRRQPL